MINGGFSYMPTQKLVFSVNGNYSINDGEFDPVNMPDPPSDVADSVETYIHGANYDYSNMHTYSDMSYNMLNTSFKLDYMVSPAIKFYSEVVYMSFTDDTGYVFGDETGSVYIIRSGIGYSF